ncbi:MAG: OmpA family protein [Alphaproteobacteria bacterium]
MKLPIFTILGSAVFILSPNSSYAFNTYSNQYNLEPEIEVNLDALNGSQEQPPSDDDDRVLLFPDYTKQGTANKKIKLTPPKDTSEASSSKNKNKSKIKLKPISKVNPVPKKRPENLLEEEAEKAADILNEKPVATEEEAVKDENTLVEKDIKAPSYTSSSDVNSIEKAPKIATDTIIPETNTSLTPEEKKPDLIETTKEPVSTLPQAPEDETDRSKESIANQSANPNTTATPAFDTTSSDKEATSNDKDITNSSPSSAESKPAVITESKTDSEKAPSVFSSQNDTNSASNDVKNTEDAKNNVSDATMTSSNSANQFETVNDKEYAPVKNLEDGTYEVSLTFDEDDASISESLENQIKTLALSVRGKENISLRLMSYAKGDENSISRSRRLSLTRALAVRSKLMDYGIRSTRIEVRALGNTPEGNNEDRMDIYKIYR